MFLPFLWISHFCVSLQPSLCWWIATTKLSFVKGPLPVSGINTFPHQNSSGKNILTTMLVRNWKKRPGEIVEQEEAWGSGGEVSLRWRSVVEPVAVHSRKNVGLPLSLSLCLSLFLKVTLYRQSFLPPYFKPRGCDASELQNAFRWTSLYV